MKLHALIFLVLFIGLSYSKCPVTKYFFESYKDVKLKILEQQFNMHHAIAEINYAVGTSIIQ